MLTETNQLHSAPSHSHILNSDYFRMGSSSAEQLESNSGVNFFTKGGSRDIFAFYHHIEMPQVLELSLAASYVPISDINTISRNTMM